MEVRECMCSTYLVPTVSVSILLLSMTALWELLKEERSGWATSLQGTLMEMCWATSQRGVIPSMERGPSLQLIGEYQQEMHYSFLSKASRCSFQLRRGPFVTFVCVCVCVRVCVLAVVCVFDSHPSFSSFAATASAIKSYCFYSISCHYQRQFDYWVHLAGGEQWRQQAVFFFTNTV